MRRGIATLAELRSGAWTIDDVMRFNDKLDDEDEADIESAERQRMEQQMQRMQTDMQRRSRGRR